MLFEEIKKFINNSKQFEDLVLNNTCKDGTHTIEALFHNLDGTFSYSIDRVETNQIKSIKGLRNINETMEAVKW